jgi:hypothetical protein
MGPEWVPSPLLQHDAGVSPRTLERFRKSVHMTPVNLESRLCPLEALSRRIGADGRSFSDHGTRRGAPKLIMRTEEKK